jgi:chemotaxis protein histidine kinase CheA
LPGVTTLSNGQIVLILDMKELLGDLTANNDRDGAVRTDAGAGIFCLAGK